MKAHFRAMQGRLVVEVEADSVKGLFDALSPIAEVLAGDDACGKCGSPHIYPHVRGKPGEVYYELLCGDCGAALGMGQHKTKPTMWAKRYDEDGNVLNHRGWKVFKKLTDGREYGPDS